MRLELKIYFFMADSFMGEVYFRVSQHLNCVMSEVIRKKFTPDMQLLIHKYARIVDAERKHYNKIKEQENLNKNLI